ncbi:prenyltransferase [Actinoplanes utahensis]|uniref:Prenyltransferase n=1 Tax=Actinoplanes utahensis TaxID=1869 RepID=A0A0A6ULX2_ACTUT|nr:prenyltransferase [Actinoplanes utahensis]KHD75279.1 prenyltransferase [Actinoplanes utahensis]GIF30469.1 prenyltransferase [Actinoplanes utahensis]
MSVPELPGVLSSDAVRATVASIAGEQEADGLIPWYSGGQADPWDHVEAAMALDVGGETERAAAAYDWLRRSQRADGSWASRYESHGVVVDPTAETNHAAYLAVGCWHHWLCTGDDEFLTRMWPTVQRALDFVTGLQGPGGQIWWAAGDEVALLTGCASIHQALRCGTAIADRIGEPQPDWELAADLLSAALNRRPELFADKSRYSMDWYYPILGGAVRGTVARQRIDERWDEFVVPGKGARCVSDQPWVTGAETCELALSLDTMGDRAAATEMVAAMQHLREADGSYWTGLVLTDGVRWPVERTTWTAAAVVLAVDALDGRHPRSAIFREKADLISAPGAAAVANPAP